MEFTYNDLSKKRATLNAIANVVCMLQKEYGNSQCNATMPNVCCTYTTPNLSCTQPQCNVTCAQPKTLCKGTCQGQTIQNCVCEAEKFKEILRNFEELYKIVCNQKLTIRNQRVLIAQQRQMIELFRTIMCGTGNQIGYNSVNQPGYISDNQTGCNSANQTGYNSANQTVYNSANQTGYNSANQTGCNSANQTGYNSANQTGCNSANGGDSTEIVKDGSKMTKRSKESNESIGCVKSKDKRNQTAGHVIANSQIPPKTEKAKCADTKKYRQSQAVREKPGDNSNKIKRCYGVSKKEEDSVVTANGGMNKRGILDFDKNDNDSSGEESNDEVEYDEYDGSSPPSMPMPCQVLLQPCPAEIYTACTRNLPMQPCPCDAISWCCRCQAPASGCNH